MFPLAEWIESHSGCRHNLALSGMVGSIPGRGARAPRTRPDDAERLRRTLAGDLGVDPRRVFLTHGATEANAGVLQYLARRRRGTPSRGRVHWPEYGPLYDTAKWAGFQPTGGAGRAAVALISQPRNPEGDLWDRGRLLEWAEGAADLLVDETFREFAGTRSLSDLERPGVWVTGSFTKFYGADALRVGFAAVPEAEQARYGEYHDLVYDRLPDLSVAGALALLSARERIRREVGRVLKPNRAAWRSAFPGRRVPVAPVSFDRTDPAGGDTLARRCLANSVLVCPGRYFGAPEGVRLCLSRRTFPQDLAAYLRVRNGRSGFTPTRPRPGRSTRAARRRRGVRGRERAGPA